MTATGLPLQALAAALHPLFAPPPGDGWNHIEMADLVGEALIEAAVLVGLVRRPAGVQVLLTRRTQTLSRHAGQVSFPGGRVEPGDADAVHAALRETHEEVGIAPASLVPLGYLDPLVTISGFRVVPVVAAIDSNYVPQPDPNEVAEVFEVPLAFLLDPDNLRQRAMEHRGRVRQVWEFAYPQQRIWGATAAIVLNLRERLAAVSSDPRGRLLAV